MNVIDTAALGTPGCRAFVYTERSYQPFIRDVFDQFSETRTGGAFTFMTGIGGFLQEFLYGYSGMRLGTAQRRRSIRACRASSAASCCATCTGTGASSVAIGRGTRLSRSQPGAAARDHAGRRAYRSQPAGRCTCRRRRPDRTAEH